MRTKAARKWLAWGIVVNDIPWPCWTYDRRASLEDEVVSNGLRRDNKVRIVRVEIREVKRKSPAAPRKDER